MLTQEPCTNIHYNYRDTNEGEKFIIAKYQSLEELGTIIGCAIYFKETGRSTERVIVSGYSGNHYEIERFLIEEKKIDFYKFTAGVAQYGYITDKGYFLNRTIAMLAYRNMCKKTESNQPGEDQLYLHDWNFSWSVFDKLKD